MEKKVTGETIKRVSPRAKSKVPFQITLNGFSTGDADDMVNAFENGRTSDDHTKTNIWFSKDYVHKLYLLLLKENADGIRIYFARDVNDNNDVIMVSTHVGAVNGHVPSGTDHLDYFEHTASFLTTVQTDGSILVDHGSAGTGALLYNPTSPCQGANCPIVPGHDIDCETAYAWVKNYSLSVNDKTNTTSEWFEREVIRLYDESQKTTAPGGPDGLRMYFAKRTTDPLRLVFIIVTTRAVGDIHEDYYYCFPPSKHGTDNGEQCPNNCNGTTWPA